MNLIEDIVSQGHGSLDADYICIHETANPGATARNHRDLWARDDEYAVHYVGDWTGDVYHTVPDDCLCWQVGNGNAHVIGIELCHAETQEDFDAVWRTGVEWARWILAAHGWGTDKLISHDMARQMWGGTDHTDPIGYFADYGKTWDDFVAGVANGTSTTTETTNKEEDEMHCILHLDQSGNLSFYDGVNLHRLYVPDEVTAINDVYKACHGTDIPFFELGTKDAPWGARFVQAIKAGTDDIGSF